VNARCAAHRMRPEMDHNDDDVTNNDENVSECCKMRSAYALLLHTRKSWRVINATQSNKHGTNLRGVCLCLETRVKIMSSRSI